ncbi:8-oxo-dGTP pyrophosphatase MutT (NUDIX family) [Rhizobium sp. BK313]|jgi:8-oxo-dGTP pyrophosphatase MutT (NUDIX family)|uniref:NUDIX hydrolase n=1 Tax=Rhizobium sp. BK313 TaxID=2587081 RepID=UPI00106195B0|nr:CoA pyrophosphatase [Rhizobium sp. BK313]MBB3452171.1 8-oxo-dGTP pyrophosphatase MutT (NUDIX family) [Rhizobium sp. BK313]
MSEYPLYSAAEFRRRALNQSGGPVELAWRDHGDHALNPHTTSHVEGLKLRDAAVLVPVVDDGDDANVIFTLRTSTLRKHSGQIAFPGGAIDPEDTSPEMAAVREAGEEIGLADVFIEPVARLPFYLAATGFRITPILAVVKPGFELALNPTEVEDAFEVPLSFLMDPGHHVTDSMVWQGIERHFYRMPYGPRMIWGITAGIVRTLYERLYS